MPKQFLTLVLSAVALILAGGCQIWQPGGSTYTDKKGAFSVRPPAEWQYTTVATASGTDLLASKDGLVLQRIIIAHRELKDALPNSKRILTATLGPYELAEAIVDDMRADHSLLAFELKENSPATIGGQPGFKLIFAFRTQEKLRLEEALYGCVTGGKLWLLRYRAPARHYFERDAAAFEETVKTFQFSTAAAKAGAAQI